MTSRWPTTAFAISTRARERASSSCSSAAASIASAEDIAAVASALNVLVTDIPPPSSRASPPHADQSGSIADNQVGQKQCERRQNPSLPCGVRDPSGLDTRKDLLLGRKHPAAGRRRERGEVRRIGAREFMKRRIGDEKRRLGGGLLGGDAQIEFPDPIQREASVIPPGRGFGERERCFRSASNVRERRRDLEPFARQTLRVQRIHIDLDLIAMAREPRKQALAWTG